MAHAREALAKPQVSAEFDKQYFDPYLEKNLLGVYRGSRPFLYGFWVRRMRRLLEPRARVLEVGCGLGFFSSRLSRYFSVVPFDISVAALSFARKQWRLTAVTCGDAAALPYRSGAFGAIAAFDIVEHLAAPEQFLSEAFRVLRPRGVLVLTTPNPDSFGARLKGTPETAHPDRVWFGYRDKTHVSMHRIDEWRRMFARANFQIVRDGTDFLWDVPYFRRIPLLFQKLLFNGTQWVGSWLVGFLPWRLGENYVAILRKSS